MSLFNGDRKKEDAAKIGQAIVEGAKEHPRREVREKWSGVAERHEDLQEKMQSDESFVQTEALSDDTDLYTTLQADIIQQALEPELFGLDAINTMQFELQMGVDSIQVPQGQQLTAVELNADGTLSEDTTDYQSTNIGITWVGVRTTFSGQLVQKAKVDLLAYRMQQAGRAIARKVDGDIVSEMVDATRDPSDTAASGDYNDNSNYLYGGLSGGSNNSDDGFTDKEVTYDVIVEGIAGARSNDADPDLYLTNTGTWATLMKDSDMKQALGFGTTTDGDIPMVQRFGALRVRATSQMPVDESVLVDTDRTGMFIDASSVETFDGRVNEAYQFEVLAVKAYGVKITQPQTLYGIHENQDAPA